MTTKNNCAAIMSRQTNASEWRLLKQLMRTTGLNVTIWDEM